MPFTYIVAFFPKTSRGFKKIVDFSNFFGRALLNPYSARRGKCLHHISTFFCKILQSILKIFQKVFFACQKGKKSGTPRQGVGGRAPSKIRKFAKKVVYTLDFRRLLLYNK